MEKISLVEILKNCPRGMELDCKICNGVKFIDLDRNPNFPIVVRANNGYEFTLTKYGQVHNIDDAKCVIFPKGKTTWDGFIPPIEFKDGDIITDKHGNIAIYKKVHKYFEYPHIDFYCGLVPRNKLFVIKNDKYQNWGKIEYIKFATEKEKETLFKTIKDNGYKWNPETRTLEKLIEPKFKVGARVLWNYNTETPRTISRVELTSKRGYVYWIDCEGCSSGWWDETELTAIPNKFDINTLVPFESRVLVRGSNDDIWKPAIWGIYNDIYCSAYPYITTYGATCQCIPYEGNEHLLGTTNDCSEFYKSWE